MERYPSYRYHPTEAPRIVADAQEDAALALPWRDHPYGGEDEPSQEDAEPAPSQARRR